MDEFTLKRGRHRTLLAVLVGLLFLSIMGGSARAATHEEHFCWGRTVTPSAPCNAFEGELEGIHRFTYAVHVRGVQHSVCVEDQFSKQKACSGGPNQDAWITMTPRYEPYVWPVIYVNTGVKEATTVYGWVHYQDPPSEGGGSGTEVPDPPPPAIGVVTGNGDLWVKEGNLRAPWVNEGSGFKDVSISHDRTHGVLIGALTATGHALVKSGLNGQWVDEASNVTSVKVATDSTNGAYVGVISNGHAYVKKGLSGGWVDESAGVSDLSIATDPANGVLIGVIASEHAYVKKGLSGTWVDEFGGVKSVKVATDSVNGPLIGVLTNGTATYVKTGSLTAPWVEEESGDQAIDLATDPVHGPLIGILKNGTAKVKQGSLYGSWVDELGSAKSLSLESDGGSTGPLIGVLTTGGIAFAKEGSLTGEWVEEFGGIEKLDVGA